MSVGHLATEPKSSRIVVLELRAITSLSLYFKMFSILQTVAAIFVLAIAVQAQNDTVMVDVNITVIDGPPTPSSPPVTMMSTTMMAGDNNNNNNGTDVDGPTSPAVDDNETTVAAPEDSTTTTSATTPTVVISSTTEEAPCNNSIGRLSEIYDFTNTQDFPDMLSQNEQILVYEVLAAAEGCKMASFMNAETAERIFRMLGSLPVKHVYIFLHYMAQALESEGVSVPV